MDRRIISSVLLGFILLIFIVTGFILLLGYQGGNAGGSSEPTPFADLAFVFIPALLLLGLIPYTISYIRKKYP